MAFSSFGGLIFSLISCLLINWIEFVQSIPRSRGGASSENGHLASTKKAVYGYENFPPEYKTSETFTWYNIPIWGWILIALPIMGIIAICVALAAWKIIAQLARYDTYESTAPSGGSPLATNSSRNSSSSSSRNSSTGKILCPLCVKKISERSWKSGRHRQKCARKYQVKIDNDWPIFDPSVICPSCAKSLRKMTTNRLLKCSLCPNESIIGCFVCDFNVCQPCINHQRAQQLIEVVEINQTTQDLTVPASASAQNGQRNLGRNYVPPKTSVLEFDPTAPSYEAIVTVTDDEYLPSYEEALALANESKNI